MNDQEKQNEIIKLLIMSVGTCHDIIYILSHTIKKNKIEVDDNISHLFDQNSKYLKKVMELNGEKY